MIDLLKLEPGTKLILVGGRTAEVVENMEDGQWVLARILTAPDASAVGMEELCHSQDILAIQGLDTSET